MVKIGGSLFLIAVLQFTEAAIKHLISCGKVTLNCENVIEDQRKCVSTAWVFTGSRSSEPIELFLFVEIGKEGRSDRLSLTENCSLEIKNLAAEDAGLYTCLQYKKSGQKHSEDAVQVSVVTMTEQKNGDEVTLDCSVSTFGRCPHTVRWRHDEQEVKDERHLNTWQSDCSASLTLASSHHVYKSRFESLKCEVDNGYTGMSQSFPFNPQASGVKHAAPADCSLLNYVMLVMRVVELLLVTVVTVLLIRTQWNRRPPDGATVREDDDFVVKYENVGGNSASVTFALSEKRAHRVK